jgi:hypothetical protein
MRDCFKYCLHKNVLYMVIESLRIELKITFGG